VPDTFVSIYTDLGNATINGGGGLVLGRGPSPAIVDNPTLGPLAANSLLNGGFQPLSSSTSPILSQGAGKIIISYCTNNTMF